MHRIGSKELGRNLGVECVRVGLGLQRAARIRAERWKESMPCRGDWAPAAGGGGAFEATFAQTGCVCSHKK